MGSVTVRVPRSSARAIFRPLWDVALDTEGSIRTETLSGEAVPPVSPLDPLPFPKRRAHHFLTPSGLVCATRRPRPDSWPGAHDPGRSEQALSRTGEFAEGFAVDFPGLAAADCCAVAASAIAGSVQEGALTDAWHRARKLAAVARSLVLGALDGAPMEALGDSLALVVRALLDLGERPAEVHDLLAEFPAEVGVRAAALLDGPAGTAEETGEPETEASLRRQVQRFSALADGPQLRQHLDRYLGEVAAREARVDWLPWLFEALVDAGDDVSPALVVSMTEGGDPLLRVRVLAATARAQAEGGRHHEAVRWATEAASTAARMDPQLAEARVLVAQAFAHAGEAAQAASWTLPPSGRRPYGRAGIPCRRAALAVRAGLEPASFVAEVMADGLSDGVLTAAGNDVVAALRAFASGARVEAHYGSLRTTAHARLATEPLLATGLALLQAVQGDDEGAHRTAGPQRQGCRAGGCRRVFVMCSGVLGRGR